MHEAKPASHQAIPAQLNQGLAHIRRQNPLLRTPNSKSIQTDAPAFLLTNFCA